MLLWVKFGPTTPLVGVGLSENFDLGCVEKLLCSRGLGSPFCLLAEDVSVDAGDEYEANDTCVGGDLGLKCGLKRKQNKKAGVRHQVCTP